MKKCVSLLVVAAVVVFAGISFAVESQKLSTARTTKMVDRNGDGRVDGVDIYDENGKIVKMGYDTDNNMMVDKWETTDDNTGLPIVVASDEAFELR